MNSSTCIHARGEEVITKVKSNVDSAGKRYWVVSINVGECDGAVNLFIDNIDELGDLAIQLMEAIEHETK